MSNTFNSNPVWGFSPALDLQKEYLNLSLSSKFEELKLKDDSIDKELDPFNICLIGTLDCRHILKTLAHAKRYPKRKINIYVLEISFEIVARHMLLMSIALEPKERLGLQEKTELFLELFGNSLIRPQTSEYLQSKSTEFIRMVTDLDYLETCLPCFNLSLLKFGERDILEKVFKFWRNTDPKVFDICKIWDKRLRDYLGARYDSRANIFDWDLVVRLQSMGSVVNAHEYKNWREQGVAFELRDDSTYEVSNKTLASELVLSKGGEKVACRGYWGDIVNSPYISFGIESEEQRLFKVVNGHHSKTATDVTEFNVMALIHELTTGEKYHLPDKGEKKAKSVEKATISEISEEGEEQAGKENELEAKEEREESSQAIKTGEDLKMDGFKIHFMPRNFLADFYKRPKFQHLFHSIYYSYSFSKLLSSEVANAFADEAVVTVETTKFMLDQDREFTRKCTENIIESAHKAGCQPLRVYDGHKDAHAVFSFKRAENQDLS